MPKLLIDWVEIESNYFPEWPTASHKSILIESPNKDDEPTYVREVLSNFMRRAYRRPVSKDEVDRKAALFARLRPKEDSFEHTLVSTLAAVLCSSHFLLIAEPSTQPVAEDEPIRKRKLNSYELASRLSYFLWSSMPDQMLFELAENGQISQPTVLKKQVLRMIRDPKALAFSTHFASQWLDLNWYSSHLQSIPSILHLRKPPKISSSKRQSTFSIMLFRKTSASTTSSTLTSLSPSTN